ncbi:Trehalose import ATP-binding protein SugC [bacterium HR16]|nr:Trehalose import ATP-binding protein SugC [bacterium HR16]
MAVVETRGVKKHFGKVRAVDGVDLIARDGEFLVLLGPSGCGKTTLMRMIAGLEPPTAGDILIGGQVVNDLPPRARRVAMVFQSYALYPHKTAFDNIAFPLKAQGLRKDKIKEKVEWAATMLGITHLLERKPRELSGGERQRVALARAIVREPAVFLLDEPLSNLDAKLRHAARDELKRFQRNIGTTTLYVTHDQIEAMGLGDRIAVMHAGQIRQIGTPYEVYHEPADTFVATFVGTPPMNLIARDDVIIGFRPESFLPKEVYNAHDDLVKFHFHVRRVEHLGSDRLLYGSLMGKDDLSVIAKLPLTVSITIHEGCSYEFAVRAGDLKFFERETGLRTEAQPL